MGKFLYGIDSILLPDIYSVYTPELQKTHPFALIFNQSPFGYMGLYLTDSAPYGGRSPLGHERIEYQVGTNIVYYHALKDSKEWQFVKNDTWPDNDSAGLAGVWTNTDIFREDGSLYLAASDPVPVSPITPAAVMEGWAVGMAIRRSRT